MSAPEITQQTAPNPATTNWVPVGPGPIPDFRYQGDYVPATSYSDGDIVIYNGVTYLCVKPTTTAPVPFTNIIGALPLPVVNGQWIKGVGGAAVWQSISQADLPLNLQAGAADAPGLDCNVLTATGWYWVNGSTANTPYAGFNGFLQNYTAAWSSAYRFQLAHDYNVAQSYRRLCSNSVWAPWQLAYQAGDMNFTTPTMLNGWSHYGAPYGPGRFRKLSSGLVVCSGLVTAGTPGSTAFTFPPGCRTTNQLIFFTASSVVGMTESWRLEQNSGNLNGNGPIPASNWVSLAGVQFYADA